MAKPIEKTLQVLYRNHAPFDDKGIGGGNAEHSITSSQVTTCY